MPTSHDALAAAKEFFAVIEDPEIEASARLGRLKFSLDRLAYVQHLVGAIADREVQGEPPAVDQSALRWKIDQHFPNLGSYQLPTPVQRINSSEIRISEAIDDICDIASELRTVLWYAEHATEDDALWYFKNGYQAHWGDHLRGLQFYLHRPPVAAAKPFKAKEGPRLRKLPTVY